LKKDKGPPKAQPSTKQSKARPVVPPPAAKGHSAAADKIQP
jgi:hypothetical protein